MITKIYETPDGDLRATVEENGEYVNYIPCPELVVDVLGDGFIADARAGFLEAPLYDRNPEFAASEEEKESTLIAEFGDEIVLYLSRMGEYAQEIFAIDLGDEMWADLLERDTGAGVPVELD